MEINDNDTKPNATDNQSNGTQIGCYLLSNPDNPKEFIYVMPSDYKEEMSFSAYKALEKV